MSEITPILEQLELNSTFFHQLLIFFVLFLVLGPLFFKPFFRLIEIRHQSTVKDREAAESMAKAALAQLESYQRQLTEEKAKIRQEFEQAILEAKNEETKFLAAAREQAKKITQTESEALLKQYAELRTKLEVDVESMAFSLSEKLLSRKV